uniref:synaptic vesicle 2-related protein-like isoform X2 n=1 Tax=Myxine glutinosa TaxID=7769 RepID=UPI00358EEA25
MKRCSLFSCPFLLLIMPSLCHGVENKEGLIKKRETVVPKDTRTPCCEKESRVFTVDDAIETLGFGKFQCFLFAVCGLSSWALPLIVMTPTILGPTLQCEWNLSAWQIALISSTPFAAKGLCATMWGKLADKYGRKLCILLGLLKTFYFGMLSSFAPSYSWFIFLCFMIGCSGSAFSHMTTLFTEFLTVKTRSYCIINFAVTWSFGLLTMIGLGMLILPFMTWRWFVFISTLPLFIIFFISFTLPESAHYNMVCGQSEKALATLEWMSRFNGVPLPAGTLMTSTKQENLGRMQDLLVEKHRRTTFLLWFIWLVNSISYYGLLLLTTEFMKMDNSCAVLDYVNAEDSNCVRPCHILTRKDYLDILWTTLAEFPGLLFASWSTDFLGRKRTFTYGMLILCFSCFFLMICLERAIITVLLFVARATISGAFMVLFVYTLEVYPTEIRALSLGACELFSHIGTILAPFIAQVIQARTAAAIFGSLALLASIAAFLLPLETKGQRLNSSKPSSVRNEIVTDTGTQPGSCRLSVSKTLKVQNPSTLSLNSKVAVEQEAFL